MCIRVHMYVVDVVVAVDVVVVPFVVVVVDVVVVGITTCTTLVCFVASMHCRFNYCCLC